jgi:F-type H+-transporting ATPase subunit b
MEIDWITVSAQIVNFLILVWLLKRFLYQPVIRAMDRREQRIADRLEEAEAREQEARDQTRHYQEQEQELDRRREALLDEARERAEQEKRQLLEEARDEVRETRAKWQRQTEREKTEFLDNLRKQALDAIQLIARKALADLADAGLERQLVDSFAARLEGLDEETRQALAEAASEVRISSAFELDSATRGRLTRAVHEHLAGNLEVGYDASPALLCGIELRAGGRRLGWNLADYLEELGERVERSLAAGRPQTESE